MDLFPNKIVEILFKYLNKADIVNSPPPIRMLILDCKFWCPPTDFSQGQDTLLDVITGVWNRRSLIDIPITVFLMSLSQLFARVSCLSLTRISIILSDLEFSICSPTLRSDQVGHSLVPIPCTNNTHIMPCLLIEEMSAQGRFGRPEIIRTTQRLITRGLIGVVPPLR